MKPTIFLVLILLVSTVSAESNCENVYFFLINKLQPGNILNYSESDVLDLSNQLNISLNETKYYLTNYSIICNQSPQIPSPKIQINETDKGYVCNDAKINKTIAWIYESDWSFPIPKIHLGEYSCGKMNSYKYFLNYEKTGKFDYSITGIKLWIFIVLIVSIFIFAYARLHIRANRIIEKNR